MLNALCGVVARRNGEIHARIVEHPLGIVVLSYGGLDIEQGGIEGDGAVDVFDATVHVQTLHADFLSAWISEERRVGNECVSTYRSRGSPYRSEKNKDKAT